MTPSDTPQPGDPSPQPIGDPSPEPGTPEGDPSPTGTASVPEEDDPEIEETEEQPS